MLCEDSNDTNDEKMLNRSNDLIAADGSCADGAEVCTRLFAGLRKQGHLGNPKPIFEEVYVILLRFVLSSVPQLNVGKTV